VKQVLFLLILILWGIFQARRKAMREAERKERRQSPQPPVRRAAGPVTAAQNRMESYAESSSLYSRAEALRRETGQFLQQAQTSEPEDAKPLVVDNDRATADTERVDEIVPQESKLMRDAYEETTTVRRRISFDKESLRTFFVTKEVLGPPRSRKPHRPGVKNQ